MSSKNFFAVVLVFILCSVFFFVFYNYSETTAVLEEPVLNFTCIEKTESKIVRGNSLTGIVENGQAVKIHLGYYGCNGVKREDIVVYNYSGSENLLIKVVKGLPQDNFSLQKTGAEWNLVINAGIVKNSESIPYILNEQVYAMLSLYMDDYGGIIPENTYLILGNIAEGSLDSTHFGLIDREDISGKAMLLDDI
ncbi:MAG: signal peptidase I [archaeon]|nr:signal peptidase I [archaeon]